VANCGFVTSTVVGLWFVMTLGDFKMAKTSGKKTC